MRQAEDGGSPERRPAERRGAGAVEVLREKAGAALTFCRYALHRFNVDGCFAASGALSYTTLVSLVPLGVIALGILSAFPIFATVRQQVLVALDVRSARSPDLHESELSDVPAPFFKQPLQTAEPFENAHPRQTRLCRS